ncbi:MAG: hypothetical protein ACRCTY_03095, partial [Candidatus Adiutrix sp.]
PTDNNEISSRQGPNLTCTGTITPFDVAVWREAPYNSRKVRGLKTVALGCVPLTSETDSPTYYGLPGHSNSLMLNFDMTIFPDDLMVKKAVLAVHSPSDAQGLTQAQVRGRLNIGGEMQSVGASPVLLRPESKSPGGWVHFDITPFAARAINERRNSTSFEISFPCQNPANLVEVGVLQREAHITVEYQ